MCFRMFEVFALTRELNLICCQWQAKKFGYGMIMHLPKQSAQMQSKGHMNSCRLSAFVWRKTYFKIYRATLDNPKLATGFLQEQKGELQTQRSQAEGLWRQGLLKRAVLYSPGTKKGEALSGPFPPDTHIILFGSHMVWLNLTGWSSGKPQY